MIENHILTDDTLDYIDQSIEGLELHLTSDWTDPEALWYNIVQEEIINKVTNIGSISLGINKVWILSESHFINLIITNLVDDISINIHEILACMPTKLDMPCKLNKVHNKYLFQKIFELWSISFKYIFEMQLLSLLQRGDQAKIDWFFRNYHNSKQWLFELFPDKDWNIHELLEDNLHISPWTWISCKIMGNKIITESIHTYPEEDKDDWWQYAYSISVIGL